MTSPLRLAAPGLFALAISAPAAWSDDGAPQPSDATESTPHNTLIVLADDLGVDSLGVYGESANAPSTPNLDRLAAGGVLFRNAWTAPMCSPSRASIQTGRHPFRTGIGFVLTDDAEGLADSEVTLAEMLSLHPTVDFESGLFGKWHLGGGEAGPLDQGYKVYRGYPNNLYAPQSYTNFTRYDNGQPVQVASYATTDTVDEALAFMATAPEPWLCVVSFHAPHEPFHAPPSNLHSVDLTGAHPRTNPRPLYEAMVQAMDAEIGRMLEGMGTAFRRTNIFFAGDNGTPKAVSLPPFEPQHAKLTPYEGGINVPLIVHGPAVQVAGRECRGLVNLTDIYATVAELAGVPQALYADPSRPLDSISLLPYLEVPTRPSLRGRAYAGAFNPTANPDVTLFTWHMVRDERYKFIVVQHGGQLFLEMYDLQNDPFEQDNIVYDSLDDAARQALKFAVHELRAMVNG